MLVVLCKCLDILFKFCGIGRVNRCVISVVCVVLKGLMGVVWLVEVVFVVVDMGGFVGENGVNCSDICYIVKGYVVIINILLFLLEFCIF